MKRYFCACLVATAVAGSRLSLDAADSGRFRFLAAVYFDAKGGGLNLPEGVACDRDGNFVVADTGNNRLVRFTYKDEAITGGTEIKPSEVMSPAGVHLNSKGEIYAIDGVQRRIIHLSASGEFKDVLTFSGAPESGSIVPKAFALDPADNIYVIDVFLARVLVLNPQGQFQKAIPLPADIGFASDVTVDTTGTVFIVDSIKRQLYSAAKDATALTPLGGVLEQFVPTLPTHVTTAKGVIFLVEPGGSSIASVGREGSFLSRQLTMGWNEGALNHPAQMCVNDKDEVFVADTYNSRVEIFQLIR